MIRLYCAFLLTAIMVVNFNCQKELSLSGGDVPGPDNKGLSPVTATVQGNVVNENGQPASGVAIKVGTKTATTDSKGYFRIMEAGLDKNASLVTAEKPGYFKAYRSFRATSGTNHILIKLVKRDLAGSVSSASGGNITLSNGTKVALPANAVVKAAGGTAFSGTVNVYASYIDPTADDISQTIPGSLMADDKENNRVTLASFGMIAVELESTSGEKLQVAAGSAATLTMPIPATLQASAPASIALWYVDETTGIWKEEGSATKTGNNYVGEVKHFSFWNCDVGVPAVSLTVTIKNNEGIPIVHALVRITRVGNNSGWSTAYGWTDTLGQVSGLVPANENLLIEVLDPCNNVVYSQNAGPFSQNTNLGSISVTSSSPSMLTIKGTLKNCSNAVVTDGYALLSYDNISRYAAANSTGEFAVSFLTCTASSASVTVVGVDEATQQQGNPIAWPISLPVTDLGNISACGNSAVQFINYTLDGTDYSINSANTGDSLTSYTYTTQGTPALFTWMSGWNPGNNNSISLGFGHGAAAGTYSLSSLDVQTYDSVTLVQPFNVILTTYPTTAGEFYEGSFSGQFKHTSNPLITRNINGSFRIRRF